MFWSLKLCFQFDLPCSHLLNKKQELVWTWKVTQLQLFSTFRWHWCKQSIGEDALTNSTKYPILQCARIPHLQSDGRIIGAETVLKEIDFWNTATYLETLKWKTEQPLTLTDLRLWFFLALSKINLIRNYLDKGNCTRIIIGYISISLETGFHSKTRFFILTVRKPRTFRRQMTNISRLLFCFNIL